MHIPAFCGCCCLFSFFVSSCLSCICRFSSAIKSGLCVLLLVDKSVQWAFSLFGRGYAVHSVLDCQCVGCRLRFGSSYLYSFGVETPGVLAEASSMNVLGFEFAKSRICRLGRLRKAFFVRWLDDRVNKDSKCWKFRFYHRLIGVPAGVMMSFNSFLFYKASLKQASRVFRSSRAKQEPRVKKKEAKIKGKKTFFMGARKGRSHSP